MLYIGSNTTSLVSMQQQRDATIAANRCEIFFLLFFPAKLREMHTFWSRTVQHAENVFGVVDVRALRTSSNALLLRDVELESN